jgi:outer membrane lipoprotein-sorting protein
LAIFIFIISSTVFADDLDDFLKTFSEKRANNHALKARFTQNTLLPDETLETPGTLVYAKPRRIVMHTEYPSLTTLIDNQRAYEYDPDLKQVNIYDLEDAPQAEIFFLGFENDLERMQEAYDLGLFEPENQPIPTIGLSITPKEGDRADAYFIEVRLYLDKEHCLPYKIHIINEDSEIITLIEQCIINPKLEEGETQIDLAPSTYIIENDQMLEAVGEGGKMIPEAISIQPGESKTLNYPQVSVHSSDLPAEE